MYKKLFVNFKKNCTFALALYKKAGPIAQLVRASDS